MTAGSLLNLRRDIAATLALARDRDPRFAEALEIVLSPPREHTAAYHLAVRERPIHLRSIANRNRHRARSARELVSVVEMIVGRYERGGWQDDRLAAYPPDELTADEVDAWHILHLFGTAPRKATVDRDIRGCF